MTASRSGEPAAIQLADAPSLLVEETPARLDVATVIALSKEAPAPQGMRLAANLADRAVETPAAASSQDAARSDNAPDKPETVLFEADEVTRADETSPIIATGKVRAFAGGRYLEADRISYDQTTEIIVAEGSVSITEVVGGVKQTGFADKVQLTGDLRDGIAEHFSALLDQGARLAGYDAVREQNARTRVRKGVFSTCNVCTSRGDRQTPTWRVKALRMTRDEERKVVRFRHAFFELKGVPILYMPYIQSADPSLERASGFLTPTFGSSSRLGFNLELPYYLAFSNHTDATFHPKYVSRDGMLWQAEVRQRGNHGGHVWQAGVIDFNPNKPDATGNLPVGVPGVRWHFFGAGSRTIGDNWRLSYDL
ncbi:MAG: hypothetical protein K2Q06_09590, partial [Parvularculaceae bacterium]|nr:hypothetical protein [Parvularculaceae bacterium]